MKKIDHVGIAVNDLKHSNQLFAKLLGVDFDEIHIEEIEEQKVVASFLQLGNTKVELIEPTTADSPIAKFLDKKGEGTHHVAFEVEDIKAEMKRLKKEGFKLLSEEPRIGAGGKLICFIHPKTANGVLVELVQPVKK